MQKITQSPVPIRQRPGAVSADSQVEVQAPRWGLGLPGSGASSPGLCSHLPPFGVMGGDPCLII